MPLTAADVYSALYDPPPDEELEFFQWAAQAHGIRPMRRVLDMGCGTGRLLPGLAATDWRVVGYEPNATYAAAARAFVADIHGVRVVTGGFLDLDDNQTFDMICAINERSRISSHPLTGESLTTGPSSACRWRPACYRQPQLPLDPVALPRARAG